MQDESTPGEQGRAAGKVNRKVGTRAELNRATDPDDRERTVGSDNTVEDAK